MGFYILIGAIISFTVLIMEVRESRKYFLFSLFGFLYLISFGINAYLYGVYWEVLNGLILFILFGVIYFRRTAKELEILKEAKLFLSEEEGFVELIKIADKVGVDELDVKRTLTFFKKEKRFPKDIVLIYSKTVDEE